MAVWILNFKRIAFKAVLLLVILSNLMPTKPFIVKREEVKKEEVSNDKFIRDDNLQAEADVLLPLFDDMPSVQVYIIDEPIIKSGTNTERGVAYTNCKNNEFPSIFVKKNFYQKNNRIQLVNILKHELTHAWLCRQHQMSGHDAKFRQKFRQVGGWGN